MRIFHKNLYQQIVHDLKVLKSFEVEEQLKSYLIRLQSKATSLYQSLNNEIVEVDYSDPDIQIAYMLRYFPGYWEQLYRALWAIRSIDKEFPFNKETINIGSFGCGPCPEVIGAIRFFEETRFDLPQEINFHLYDKNQMWDFAKENFIYPKHRQQALYNFGLRLGHKISDFSQEFKLPSNFSSNYYHICCFQNCLNEFVSLCSQDVLKRNIETVKASISSNGFLVITDRQYIEKKIAAQFQEYLGDDLTLVDTISGSYDFTNESPIPDVVENLFIGNLAKRLVATKRNRRFIWIYRKTI